MRDTDGNRFRNLLRGMGRMYGADLDAAVLDAYWLALGDWEYSDFETAAKLLMETAKWMPKPAEFTSLRRSGEPTAGEAWVMVLSGAKLPPGSRLARAAEIVGGQSHIRHADVEFSLPHIQRRFLKEYEDLSGKDPVRDRVPQIAEHGAREVLSAPRVGLQELAQVGGMLPTALVQRLPSSQSENKPPMLAVKRDIEPKKGAREKITALLPLKLTDEDIAKIAGQPIDVVRQVRSERNQSREVAAA